jgi:tRNA (guanine37-N1)-methyltransferase
MVLTIRVENKDANKIKALLIKNNNLNDNYKVVSENGFVFFPIKKKFKTKHKIINKKLDTLRKEITSLKEALSKLLTKTELGRVKTAYDLTGDIAILEIDEELRNKEKLIADTLLKIRKDVKTVLRKQGSHEGTFRTQKMKYLAGEKKKIALHKENNILLKLNVEKVYFSPRLSTERKRIVEQIKNKKQKKANKEEVLVMFCGCAPYCCVIAKHCKEYVKDIIGIEINPEGHKYGLNNLKLNRLNNVGLFNGDVKKIIPRLSKLGKKFNRILMPLPKHAEDFLEDALIVSKKNTIIHFYNFLHEKEFNKAEEMIKNACKKASKKCKILKFVKCGQQSPGVYRICIDFKIL